MIVVVGGGVVGGSSLLTIGSKELLVSVIQLSSQLKFSLGWDPSLLKQISLRGGISPTYILYIPIYNGICQGEISE